MGLLTNIVGELGAPKKHRIIIKIGGNEIDNPSFLEQLVKIIKQMGGHPIIIHGGGKEITDLQEKLGIKAEKVQGLRVTDLASLRVTEMILSGLVNKRLVRLFEKEGIDAIGISGVDNHLFRAEKLRIDGGDLGFVGFIVDVNADFIVRLLSDGLLPVVSPMSLGKDGQVYNVNADSAAQALAEALKVETLVFITDVPGVKINDVVQETLKIQDLEGHIQSGQITGGMIPKVRAAIKAVQMGVHSVVITNAPNFIAGKGTKIKK